MDEKIHPQILVVEDEKLLSQALEYKLKIADYRVLIAKNGVEGLKLAMKHKPDLILLDLIMPKMNGVDMLNQLRQDTWGKTVPVLIFTNDINPESMSSTLKDNALDYLIKSDWDLENILQKIKSKLKN